MKKIAKKSLIAILIFSLVLSAFAGCSGITLDEEYGFTMTDKTVTYDSESHDMKIAVDNSLLVGKNYTVTYASGNKALTNPSFKEVGTYPVTATVTIEGEDAFTLDATMTIVPVELNLEIGDIFLRQGQGISSLGNPRDLFKEAGFVGDDTETSLGSLKFEIYDGSTKVTDLSKLKPSTSANKGYKVKIVAENTSTNYKVTFKEGELFVMSGGDFDVSSSLKTQIATVPTSTTINEMNYSEMRSFVSSASAIIKDYPKATELQRKMSGSVNITEVEALYEIAKDRVNTVYKLEDEMASSAGSVIFLGASHPKNEARDEDDDDYIDDFEGKDSKAKSTAEVGDEVAFAIQIKDLGENKFLGCYVKDLFLDASVFEAYIGLVSRDDFIGTTTLKPLTPLEAESHRGSITYVYGTPRKLTDVTQAEKDAKDYDTNNTGTNGGVNISTNLLGKLDGFSSIDFTPLIGQSATVGLYSDGYTANALTKENMETELVEQADGSFKPKYTSITEANAFDIKTGRIYGEEIASFRIISNGDTMFEISDVGSKDVNYKNKQLVIGQEYEISLLINEGYELLEMEIGDEIVLPSSFDDDSFTFTLTEDHLTGDIVKIIPRFVSKYSFSVYEDGRTLRNEDEAGFHEGEYSNVTLDGVEEGKIPTMDALGMLSIQVEPADYYQVNQLEIVGNIWDSTSKKFISTDSLKDTDANEYKVYSEALLEDLLSSHNSTISLEMGEGDFNFKLINNMPIEINLDLGATFPVTATAVFDKKETVMSGSNGEFTSEYGEVSMWNDFESKTSLNTSGTMSEDSKYFLSISNEDGYIPVGISINGISLASTTGFGDMNSGVGEVMRRYLMDRGTGTTYLIKNESLTLEEAFTNSKPRNDSKQMLTFDGGNLDAGEAVEIEIEYVSYYDVSVGESLSDWAAYYDKDGNAVAERGITKYEIGVGKILKNGSFDSNWTSSSTDKPLSDKQGSLVYNSSSAIIAVEVAAERYSYYVYGASEKDDLDVTILGVNETEPSSSIGDRDVEIEIGNEIKIKNETSSGSSFSFDVTIEEAIRISQDGTGRPIKPGDEISISVSCKYYRP